MSGLRRISVLGDGGWGTTLAILLSRKGLDVTLWSAFADYARLLDKKRINPFYLKGIGIPRSIRVTADLKQALDAQLIVLAVPSSYLRGVLDKGKLFYDRSIPVVSVVKGIETGTLLRMSQVIAESWRSRAIAVLSGPTIALEVARGVPSAAVVACKSRGLRQVAQDLFMSSAFRIYTNPDVVGVEMGGSCKNIIAIACGISDGLGFGTNTKAAIVARGLKEMARLGVAMGASAETFRGISGLGDLVTTCFSRFSRNHYLGERIGRGFSLKEVAGRMKMVAEGVPTAKAAYLLGKRHGVELPITGEIYHVLFRQRSACAAVTHLMGRARKAE